MSDETKQIIEQAKAQARRENIKNFLGKNAKEIKIIVISILVVTIIYAAYAAFQSSQRSKYSSMLHQALIDQQSGDEKKANEALKNIYEAKFAPSQVKSIAGLRYAAFLLGNGKKAEAVKVYEEIADCFSCNEYLRNLAAVIGARVLSASSSSNEIEQSIKQIHNFENLASIMKYQVSEQRAILEMQRGNFEKSYEIFELIFKSNEASQDLKDRAQNFMNILVSKGFAKKDESVSKQEK